ncbi:MAG: DUF4292 domain-containing protein [Saprospiraceae bacterium]
MNNKKGIKNWNGLILIFLVGMLGMTSCKSTTAVQTDGSVQTKPARFLLKKMETNALDFEWFNGKAKIKYVDMTQNRSIKASIRIQKGKQIWMSFSLFGFEGARVKITPDSVFVINRINKEYTAKSLSYLEQQFKLPASYPLVEALLVGNPATIKGSEYTVAIKNNQYLLNTKTPADATYILNGLTYQLAGLIIKDEQQQKVDIEFKEYEATEDGRQFSYLRDIIISSPKRGNASTSINYTKVQFDVEKQMNFKIPNGYKVVD